MISQSKLQYMEYEEYVKRIYAKRATREEYYAHRGMTVGDCPGDGDPNDDGYIVLEENSTTPLFLLKEEFNAWYRRSNASQ